MRERKTKAQRREKKEQAIPLIERGVSSRKISQLINVSRFSIQKWIKIYHEFGADGLLSPPPPNMSKLSNEEIEVLKKIIKEDARLYGFRDARWMPARIRLIIKREFDVDYSLQSINPLLKRLGVPLLNVHEIKALAQMLVIIQADPPSEYGYKLKFWNTYILVELTEALFGLKYSQDYVRHYMNANGFSFGVPNEDVPDE